MARTAVRVVRVGGTELGAFETLWIKARSEGGQSADFLARQVRDGRIRDALDDADVRIHIAFLGEEAVGYLVVSRTSMSRLTDERSVWIEQVYVSPTHRRRGIAKALLSVVPGFAETTGSSMISATIPSTHREVNRLFARLGFVNAITLRTTTPGVLRRHLGPKDPAERPSASVVRLRRSIRGRAREAEQAG